MIRSTLSAITKSSLASIISTRSYSRAATMKEVDSAIVKALGISSDQARIKNHGGSGFSQTLKLIVTKDSSSSSYFVKVGGPDSATMLEGEHASLNAINSIDPSFCPAPQAFGPLASGRGYFLITDFLDLSAAASNPKEFAPKLAHLHAAPTPVPEGYSAPQFGFPLPTACGDTVQDNRYAQSWAEFYGDRRLRGVLKACEKTNGKDEELEGLVERTVSQVVPRLLRDGHLTCPDGSATKPSLVHGDLWSGNHGRTEEGEVVYDPSSSWSHAEFEWGIMKMFGGFGKGVEEEYYKSMGGKDKPVEEWADRVRLYEL